MKYLKYTAAGLRSNALDFICMGYEDYERSKQDKKRIKSALKHLVSAIEILIKFYILKNTEKKHNDMLIFKVKNFFIINSELNIDFDVKEETIDFNGAVTLIKQSHADVFAKKQNIEDLKNDINMVKKKRNELEHADISHHTNVLKHYTLEAMRIILSIIDLAEVKNKLKNYNEISLAVREHEKEKSNKIEMFSSDQKEAAYDMLCVYCSNLMVYPSKKKAPIEESEFKCNECEKTFSISCLIEQVEKSDGFWTTHKEIASLNKLSQNIFAIFNKQQKNSLINAIVENSQINYIIDDDDVRQFALKVCQCISAADCLDEGKNKIIKLLINK